MQNRFEQIGESLLARIFLELPTKAMIKIAPTSKMTHSLVNKLSFWRFAMEQAKQQNEIIELTREQKAFLFYLKAYLYSDYADGQKHNFDKLKEEDTLIGIINTARSSLDDVMLSYDEALFQRNHASLKKLENSYAKDFEKDIRKGEVFQDDAQRYFDTIIRNQNNWHSYNQLTYPNQVSSDHEKWLLSRITIMFLILCKTNATNLMERLLTHLQTPLIEILFFQACLYPNFDIVQTVLEHTQTSALNKIYDVNIKNIHMEITPLLAVLGNILEMQELTKAKGIISALLNGGARTDTEVIISGKTMTVYEVFEKCTVLDDSVMDKGRKKMLNDIWEVVRAHHEANVKRTLKNF